MIIWISFFWELWNTWNKSIFIRSSRSSGDESTFGYEKPDFLRRFIRGYLCFKSLQWFWKSNYED